MVEYTFQALCGSRAAAVTGRRASRPAMRWVEESAVPALDLATLQRELGLQARRKGAAGRTAADSRSGTWP